MPAPRLALRSLAAQVYDHLKDELQSGRLAPGRNLDLGRIEREMGISRTPLRDALRQLECEGFVEILPRRGVRVVELTLEHIRDIYELLGALESSVVRHLPDGAGPRIAPRMRALNAEMLAALAGHDFERFYARNLELHDCYLDLSRNAELVRQVQLLKQRLYDFPRKRGFLEEWERASTDEHAMIVELLDAGDHGAAADFLRDVHWSFVVQERYIRRYHLSRQQAATEVEP